MSGTTVNLDDICAYITNVAANHATRNNRAHTAPHGKAHEQVSFVLRRLVEELQAMYGPGATITAPNQTYRNRARS